MTPWYLSFPLLGTLWKLKLGRTFWEAVNRTLQSIGTETWISYQCLFRAYLCVFKSLEQSQLARNFY